MPRRACIFQ